ncbi:hypothetical protein C2G38_2200054 [Gigaspora rosea]|uniref:Uncharacterized protein n=1 Tax=Gigaspora rosea TaxID=44941 RepID=A0A397UR28_9GLOM|nr:hypothetical protein C2G38_2200054 [Gigaspora rosea]
MSNTSLSVTTSYQHKLGKSEYLKKSENKSNSLEKTFRKRTLQCSQAGLAESKEYFLCLLSEIFLMILNSNRIITPSKYRCSKNRALLKEEFDDHVTWMYDDIYNIIYHLEGSDLEKREIDAEEFVKILDQFKYDDAEFFYYIDVNEDTKRLEQAI